MTQIWIILVAGLYRSSSTRMVAEYCNSAAPPPRVESTAQNTELFCTDQPAPTNHSGVVLVYGCGGGNVSVESVLSTPRRRRRRRCWA